jgi:hypothetical protein
MLPFRTLIVAFALLTGVLTSFSVIAYESIFDRLDGTGPSKKRVDVVEWEGNLEIHVYPKSSTKGLGAKLDTRESGKKVMVIGYHFNGSKEPLVRRAILGVPFTNNLKGYVDPSEKEFDKFALSNQELPKPWVPYQLLPAPKQWGPDGSKYDEDSSAEQLTEMKKNDQQDYNRFNSGYNRGEGMRAPASVPAAKSKVKEKYVHPAQRDFNKDFEKAPAKAEHNDGGVQEYSW